MSEYVDHVFRSITLFEADNVFSLELLASSGPAFNRRYTLATQGSSDHQKADGQLLARISQQFCRIVM